MGAFITGTLMSNKSGATYEGKTYDRRLRLIVKGKAIPIFDHEAMSEGLQENEQYEMLLSVNTPWEHRYFRGVADALPDDWWEGQITDLDWQIPSDMNFLRGGEGLKDISWVLLNTLYGDIVFGQRNVREMAQAQGITHPQVGDTLQWENPRFILYGVIAKHR